MKHRPSRPRGPSQAGFALVELLVVIAVIALLMAILMPTLSKARRAMYRAKCGSNLREVCRSMMTYAGAGNLHRGTQPYALPSVGPKQGNWGDMKEGNPGTFWLMLTGRQPNQTPLDEVLHAWVQPAALLCPETGGQGISAPEIDDGQMKWDDQRKTYCYSYLSQVPFDDGGRTYTATSIEEAGSDLAILADRNPACTPGTRDFDSDKAESNSPNHGGEGQNVVCLDQSVRWLEGPEDPSGGGDNIYDAEPGGNADDGERADTEDVLLIP